MEYISSPANWFLREKTTIVGLTQLGIRSISKQNIISIALPKEKDGIVFDSVHDCFFQSLADYGKGIEEVCISASIKIRAKRGAYEKPFPATCSFKKLTLMSIEHFNSNYVWFRLNDSLEAVSLPDDSDYETKDGVIYSKDCTAVVYYPRSKPGDTFVLPETVACISSHAFQNTKLLKKLVCSRELIRVCERAFDNSSITELVTPSGTIKDDVELKDGFLNCRFSIPRVVPAYTHKEACAAILQAITENKYIPHWLFGYLKSADDEIIDAMIKRFKETNNSISVFDAQDLLVLMDRMPITNKTYKAYMYLLKYKGWDDTFHKERGQIVWGSIERFSEYWLSGHKGEVQRDEAFIDGVCILGDMPSKMVASEDVIKAWLKEQILELINFEKRVFVTETRVGVCCLAAEIILQLKDKYPGIKLVLLSASTHEYEKTGFGKYDRYSHQFVYDVKVTDESKRWEPRIDVIKEKADWIYGTRRSFDGRSWILSHCGSLITVWNDNEAHQRFIDAVNDKGLKVYSYSL